MPDKERWLLSYADLLTLLLAFFIVMYSMSVVNESKLKELSESMETAMNPSEVSQPKNGGGETDADLPEALNPNVDAALVAQQITRLGYKDIRVTNTHGDWLEITLKSEVLFESGQAGLKVAGGESLDQLMRLVHTVRGQIQIEGHTDNRPIATANYPSNWELSAARAAAVVRFMESNGVAGNRLAAMGLGATQPLADNETAEGRNKNRRVVFKVKQSQIDFQALLALSGDTSTGDTSVLDVTAPQDLQYQDPQFQDIDLDNIDPALLEQVLRELENEL